MPTEIPQPVFTDMERSMIAMIGKIAANSTILNEMILDLNHLKARVYKIETELESP